jgi:hypothetical protein
MAPNSDEDLVGWAAEVRGVEQLQADPAIFEEIRDFLLSHEAESSRSATHVVLENFPDWWTRSRRAPPGLEINRPEELEELYRHVGTLFGLGIPLTLAERRTPVFRLFQDLEAWGTREASMTVDELIGPDTALTRLIGSVIGEVFPGHGGFLDAAIFDATGLSQTKGVRKTSLRLVWPGIIVDSDRAARVRDLLVHKVTAASADEGSIAELQSNLKDHNQANAWHSFFGDAAYAGRSNVRMPLCDRVSPLPLRAPEHRPLVSVGVLRFLFSEGGKMKIEWLCRQAELEHPEWVKIGCLRQTGNGPAEPPLLTEWTVPAISGNQPIPPSSTRTGRVKVRTAGGSDGGGGLRLRSNKMAPTPERAGQLLMVERRFNGTSEQFCEKMEQHLGKATVEADGAFVWKQPGGEARIMMYGEDRRVKVVGRPNQVRSLVVIVAPFTEAQQGYGPAVSRPDGPGPLPNGRLPSDAYAPGGNEETEAIDERQAELPQDNSPAETSICKQLRYAIQAFEPEGQGELALRQGETVRVAHDPEGEHGDSQDRWVYGRSEESAESGWFPLSHTLPVGGDQQVSFQNYDQNEQSTQN